MEHWVKTVVFHNSQWNSISFLLVIKINILIGKQKQQMEKEHRVRLKSEILVSNLLT